MHIWNKVEDWTTLEVDDIFMEHDSICGRISGQVLTKPVREGDEEKFQAKMEDGSICDYFRNIKYKHCGPKVYLKLAV